MAPIINVLLHTFPGLGLPSTVCIPLPATATTEDVLHSVTQRLPRNLSASSRLILTTASNRAICPSQITPLSELVKDAGSDILSLRLSVPLCGGKGGFGSQLRAAGGRMSSRKRKQNAELATGSARNLDGRRLRTITEAKNLAAYLATKPEMDRKEKEERRKRWEQVVELAEQRETDMRAGKTADGRRVGLSEEWIEEKEEVGENVRNAVKLAMIAKEKEDNTSGGSSSRSERSNTASDNDDSDTEDVMDLDDDEVGRLKLEAEAGDADALWVLKNKLNIPLKFLPQPKQQERKFAGFDDEDDEYLSSSSGEEKQGTAD